MFEVVIVHAVQFYRKETNKAFGYVFLLVWCVRLLAKTCKNLQAWLTSAFRRFVAWLGGSAAAWSLGVSYILHIQATTQRSVEHLAMISNVGAVVVPICYLSILLPFACLAGRGYSDAIEVFQAIDKQLMAKAALWKQGDAFSPFELAPMLPLFQKMVDHFEVFLKWFKPTFIFYGVTALLLTMVRGILTAYSTLLALTFATPQGLVSIAYVHLSSLRRLLQSTRQNAPNLQGPNASMSMSRRLQHKRVEQTLRVQLLLPPCTLLPDEVASTVPPPHHPPLLHPRPPLLRRCDLRRRVPRIAHHLARPLSTNRPPPFLRIRRLRPSLRRHPRPPRARRERGRGSGYRGNERE